MMEQQPEPKPPPKVRVKKPFLVKGRLYKIRTPWAKLYKTPGWFSPDGFTEVKKGQVVMFLEEMEHHGLFPESGNWRKSIRVLFRDQVGWMVFTLNQGELWRPKEIFKWVSHEGVL